MLCAGAFSHTDWLAILEKRLPANANRMKMLLHTHCRLLLGALLLGLSIMVIADPGDTWNSYFGAGNKAYQHGNYADAESQFMAALKIAEAFRPQDQRVASLERLAQVYQAQGKYADASSCHRARHT